MSVADWFGIAGFLLSLCLAIIEFLRRYTCIRIECVELYPMCGDLSGDRTFIRAIFENHSSLPVAVSAIEISFPECGGMPLRAIRGEHVIMKAASWNAKHSTKVREELCNSPVPINLNPYESREIVAYFVHLPPRAREYLRLLWERNHQELEEGHHPKLSVSMHVHLATSRRPVSCPVHASVENYTALLSDLRANVELRS